MTVLHWLQNAFPFTGVLLSEQLFVKEEKPNIKNLHTSHTHRHIHTYTQFSSKQKPILRDQIMQTLFKRLKTWGEQSTSQFSFLIMKSQVSKILVHKNVPLDLQDILMHAEVLCWLRPKLGAVPRPAGTHECDSITCTNIHEVRA